MLIAISPIKNEQCTAKFFSGLSETARHLKDVKEDLAQLQKKKVDLAAP